MKTSFIDINKPFGLCSMYLFILMIMIVICRHLWLPKIKRFGPKWCKVTSYYHKNQDSKTLFLEFQFQLELALLISSIFSLTVPPPLHSNLQSLLGITNKSLNIYTILEKQIKKRVERIQIELLYFPIFVGSNSSFWEKADEIKYFQDSNPVCKNTSEAIT